MAPLRATRLGQVGTWLGHEALWSVDVFTRMFATVVVLRTVSQLVTTWWFPQGVWDASPTLVRGFGGVSVEDDEEEDADGDVEAHDSEEFVMTADGERFYRHSTRHQGQYWPCPIVSRDPCRECAWFAQDLDRRPRCAAVVKLALRHHERYRHFTLEEIRVLIEQGRPGVFV